MYMILAEGMRSHSISRRLRRSGCDRRVHDGGPSRWHRTRPQAAAEPAPAAAEAPAPAAVTA